MLFPVLNRKSSLEKIVLTYLQANTAPFAYLYHLG